MNNGYNNQIKFVFEYKSVDANFNNQDSLQDPQAIYSWSSAATKSSKNTNNHLEKNNRATHRVSSKNSEVHEADHPTTDQKFIYPQEHNSFLKLNFQEISYKLIDGTSQIELDPICPLKVPLTAFSCDSISATFKMVPLPQINSTTSCENHLSVRTRAASQSEVTCENIMGKQKSH
ncbi:CFC_HP_G0103030.mRNA.1.CDS.1 [Saccharomyces cerevisiae]|nr:CFC_HP_G0103030.mRNA.1.CDS.1 [Saccharomyces cerevisiae]CAI6907569.1 CFC_HP_G0103030.mRNA.1.CDS.1 [Saccharomyces cerevisiae]